VRVGTWRWPLAAALLLASAGSSPTTPEEPPAAAPDAGAPLGEELERSEGVIVPADPGADPEMVQPPPDTGGAATMPVIPPPGAPGGDPNVRPQ
jgi:hypothetical protein